MRRLPDMFEAIESLGRRSYRNMEIVFVAEGPEELGHRVETQTRGIVEILLHSEEASASPT